MKKILKKDFKNTFLENLLELHDCPKEIFYEGKLENFSDKNLKFITIVGSRSVSAYGKMALEKIIKDLEGFPVVIISGLALGVDSLAHKFSLENKLPTISVPGSGLSEKVLYPRSNFFLAQEILKKEGLLLSEFEEDFKATPWSFPKRNRIMSALSDFVLIVEAREKSGTLITARMALEYNKNMGVVPAGIFSESAKGSNKLIRDGAYPIFSGNDILEILGFSTEEKKEKNLDELNSEEKEIYKIISSEISKEEILEKSKFEKSKTLEILSLLEIKGFTEEKLGKIWKK